MNKKAKLSFGWILAIIAAVLVIGGVINLGTLFGTGGTSSSSSSGGGIPPATYQPTASYATFDKFGTTSVTGTSYYKKGGLTDGLPASTTAIANTDKGQSYTYWVANASNSCRDNCFYVEPSTFTAGQTDTIVNKKAYNNGTTGNAPTVTVYDLINRATVDAAGSTTSTAIGASGQAKFEIDYLGQAKYSALPFGGVIVVEYNASFTSLTCSGDGVVGPNNKFQVTYTPASTANVYKVYELANGFDIGNGVTGVTKVIKCEFAHNNVDETNSTWYVKTIPAGYYLGNDGNIYLDTEQTMNGLTTRVGTSIATMNLQYWS